MPNQRDKGPSDVLSGGHPTTRRGFVTGLGFGVVSLYALWAAYGAAPTSLSFIVKGTSGGGHGGGGGMSPAAFRRHAQAFIAENELPDGSVKPGPRTMIARPAPAGRHDEQEGGDHREATASTATPHVSGDETQYLHTHAGMHVPSNIQGLRIRAVERVRPAPAPRESARPQGAREKAGEREPHTGGSMPIDVYILAERFSYRPSVLRLERNVRYRFRMMGVDVNHGASITLNVRLAGHMMRAPAGRLSEMIMTFNRPGEYLVYCTVYCGAGHDRMQGKIIVT